jgi:hypothetical protein
MPNVPEYTGNCFWTVQAVAFDWLSIEPCLNLDTREQLRMYGLWLDTIVNKIATEVQRELYVYRYHHSHRYDP